VIAEEVAHVAGLLEASCETPDVIDVQLLQQPEPCLVQNRRNKRSIASRRLLEGFAGSGLLLPRRRCISRRLPGWKES
jgi:hypothetical protein